MSTDDTVGLFQFVDIPSWLFGEDRKLFETCRHIPGAIVGLSLYIPASPQERLDPGHRELRENRSSSPLDKFGSRCVKGGLPTASTVHTSDGNQRLEIRTFLPEFHGNGEAKRKWRRLNEIQVFGFREPPHPKFLTVDVEVKIPGR